MGWWQREQQANAQQAAAEKKAAEEQAKKDAAKAARAELVDSWKDLYNSGGDKALAQHIVDNHKNGGAYYATDLADAKAVLAGNTTFKAEGDKRYNTIYEQWDKNTSGNTTYGASYQTLKELMPFESYTDTSKLQSFDWATGYEEPKPEPPPATTVQPPKEIEYKPPASIPKESLINTKPKPNANSSVSTETSESPASIAKERTEEYSKNDTTITNNITQNIGNRGDTKTTVGQNNTINNSEIGDNKSQNMGSIDIKNEVWSNDDFVRSLAKERADAYKERAKIQTTNIFQNDIEQNVGNKNDWTTTVGNDNKINNSKVGNDYSLNLGNVNSFQYKF